MSVIKLSLTSGRASTTLIAQRATRGLASLALLLTLILGHSVAHAWGVQGHQVIAGLAFAQLTPKAKAEINRLLALEPGETMVSISTWADEHKNSSTARWHFVNFPRNSCAFEMMRDCPAGQCVVAAIERQAAELASNATDDKRLNALKYLVHLVGDVYQPLHAGYLDDKGGNKYQLKAFMRVSNLHAFWDSGMINSINEDADSMTDRLLKKMTVPTVEKWNAVLAAERSCQILGAAKFYPERRVGQEYVDRFTPVLEGQLSAAGVGLAALINQAIK